MYRANAVRRLIRDYPRAESEDPQSTDEADGWREQNVRRQASICPPCVINVLMSCFSQSARACPAVVRTRRPRWRAHAFWLCQSRPRSRFPPRAACIANRRILPPYGMTQCYRASSPPPPPAHHPLGSTDEWHARLSLASRPPGLIGTPGLRPLSPEHRPVSLHATVVRRRTLGRTSASGGAMPAAGPGLSVDGPGIHAARRGPPTC